MEMERQHAAKRARTEQHSSRRGGRRQGLFAPFRSLGHVSTGVGLCVQTQSSKYLERAKWVTLTSLGRSWALYDGETLKVLFAGPDMGAEITSLALSPESVFACTGPFVGRYVRGKEYGSFVTDSDEALGEILLFGSSLVALSAARTALFVWDVPAYAKPASKEGEAPAHEPVKPHVKLDLPFRASAIVHPATYLNKVVIASESGEIAIWNIRTGSLIHTFEPSAVLENLAYTHVRDTGAITTLAQSPAIDILAVGYASGVVALFDVRLGASLFAVRLEPPCPVTAVSFRSDAGSSSEEQQLMVVASERGDLAVFDLAQKARSVATVRSAHMSSIAACTFVAGQPLFMTCGEDNALRQWVIDSPAAPPRLLRERSGHRSPPHLVRYYADDGKSILSAAAGIDRSLRLTSVVRDSRGFELSQGAVKREASKLAVDPSLLKYEPVRRLAHATQRSRDWDDVLTIHEQSGSREDRIARTWSVNKKRVGKWQIVVEGEPTATCVSACGNFGLVGSSKGQVVLFNMQSGIKRKVFRLPARAAVTGLATDVLNRTVIVSTDLGDLHYYDFQTTKLDHSQRVGKAIADIYLQRENNLLAVAPREGNAVKIVDVETRRVVRELKATARVLDFALSPDSRWLITTSQDAVIRTYDLPTGQLVDAFKMASVATGVAFSPTSDFLATCHVDSVGIHLWANRAQFSEVPLGAFNEASLEAVELPAAEGELEVGELETQRPDWDSLPPYTTPDQLSEDLLTLSLMPKSRWQTLLNLETIKHRNKPVEPPKAPEAAPFFLSASDRDFVGQQQPQKTSEKEDRRILSTATIESEFVRKLSSSTFFDYLKSLSPAATDLEIGSLASLEHLEAFIKALTARLRSNRDFEAVQTYMAVFLRAHGDVLVQNDELKPLLKELLDEQRRESARVAELAQYSQGTLAFLRGAPIV